MAKKKLQKMRISYLVSVPLFATFNASRLREEPFQPAVKVVASKLSCVSLAVAALLSLPACSLYSSEKQQTYADAEGRVPEQLFNNIANPALGKNWVMAQLGPPVKTQTLSYGSLYTWALTRSESRHTQFFLLYNSNKSSLRRDYLHVVFKGDEVMKHWLDRDLAVDSSAILSRRETAKIAAAEAEISLEDNSLQPSGLIVPRRPDSPSKASQVVTTIHSASSPISPAPSVSARSPMMEKSRAQDASSN